MALPEPVRDEGVDGSDDVLWPLDANGEPVFTEQQNAYLREKWEEAKRENGPYYPAEEVFDRVKAHLQTKFGGDRG